MNSFQWPQPHLLSTWAAELVDWWGNSVSHSGKRIVFYRGKHWFVKCKPDPEELKRDYLAYLLGQKWTNVAEVSPLSEDEFNSVCSLGVPLPPWGASIRKTFLVRLAQDYTVDELPNTDIDAAAASELVFSLWTRRRDAHAANRAYNSQIPIFFDHQIAFLGEPHLRDLGVFFQPGADAGHAGRWRVRHLDAENITTRSARQADLEENLAIHYIQNFERFDESVQVAARHLNEQSSTHWHEAILKAGYSQARANEILDFLEQNRQNLKSAIEKMWSVLLQKSSF